MIVDFVVIETPIKIFAKCNNMEDFNKFSRIPPYDNLILLVTQNLIGSIYLTGALYVACCNLP
jgi:hypothetical protein